MERQHVIALATLAMVLSGCSTAAPLTVVRPVAVKAAAAKPVLERQHLPLDTRRVNVQREALTVVAPALAAGQGTLSMSFVWPESSGYKLMATAADIAKITVTLKTRSFLLMKTVATAEVQRSQIVNGRAAVNFTGLAAGDYTLDLSATDAASAVIGSGTTTAKVTDGQTTMVDAQLKLIPAPKPAETGLGVNVSIING
ncbi:MAG: hypothetical protein VKP62_04405 [Candidatus Sericytochromatia bacterium]|nr:hypothetical protein [Candidatus Sericytochromatia bacterium]